MTFGEVLARFPSLNTVVVGDLMVDEYIFGSVGRISPEAPVMVVRHRRTDRLPGGAANVARNLLAYGAEVAIAGLVGRDGDLLIEALDRFGLTQRELAVDPDRVTTRKTRVVADDRHQLLRVDHEDDRPASDAVAAHMVFRARARVEKADVVVLSDYRKGALRPDVIQELMSFRKPGSTWVANAKPESFAAYRGIDVVSLNRYEAGATLDQEVTSANAVDAARRLAAMVSPGGVLVTLGGEGMVAAKGDAVFRITAPRVEVSDPAGAGDTVIATVALAHAILGFVPEAFELAARAAACVVQHVGVATPGPADLAALAATESGILARHESS